MNIAFAKKVVSQLVQQGVQSFCICPGARNAPFIEVLGYLDECEVLSFFDERSAAFFALGRARRDGQPVAVVTTSGTAVAELLPATIEAHYTQTPLILLTADRPTRLRGTGAPQAIEQATLFQNFVDKSWDLHGLDDCDLILNRQAPYHINVCFDEPLIDSELGSFSVNKKKNVFVPLNSRSGERPPLFEKSLIVVGALEEDERKNLVQVLPDLAVPQFYEAASGLRNNEVLQANRLEGGEKMVAQLLRSNEVENVIRIGDVPLGRYWRDLDQMNLPLYSFSNKAFAGTDKSKLEVVDLSQWQGPRCEAWDWSGWQQKGKEAQNSIKTLVADFPRSEAAFFQRFSETLVHEESLYLGNSLPIRMWDLLAEHSRGFRSNRGANGIDGQLSTAFGWMSGKTKNRVVVGDLTALYDFNGLWVTPYLKDQNIDVEMVVVNNGGGQIFSRIFNNPLFRNQHSHNFNAMADFWGWDYCKVEDPQNMRPATGLSLVEWQPDTTQSNKFWENYDRLWKK